MTFTELNLVPPILRALERAEYQTPTPIQEQAIPPVLAGRDLLGCAQTGTGKTAAFAVPTLQRLMASTRPDDRLASRRTGPRPIRSLILTPTRELALQIYESFSTYGQFTGLRACVIYGGVPQRPQEQALRNGVDILVATPGRLNDLIGQGLVHLENIEILTLDEADRMLDMGFIHDVRKVIAKVPTVRQTLFFSATMPPEIVSLADSMLVRPVRISITPESPTVEAICQSLYFVDKENKRHLLAHLLQNPQIESALVFTRTKHGADRVVKDLDRAGISALAIHGNKSQNARQAALGNFKNRTTRVLVATDIAARGIDIDELSHVINFDLPDVPESYVHRIGRTGRAGNSGIAVSFCDIDEKKNLRDIERLCGRSIPLVAEHPWPMQVMTPTPKELLPQRGRRPMQNNGFAPSRQNNGFAPSRQNSGSAPARQNAAPTAPARPAFAPRTTVEPSMPAASVQNRPAAPAARRQPMQDRRVGRVVAAIDPIEPATSGQDGSRAQDGFMENRRPAERRSNRQASGSGARQQGRNGQSGQRSERRPGQQSGGNSSQAQTADGERRSSRPEHVPARSVTF